MAIATPCRDHDNRSVSEGERVRVETRPHVSRGRMAKGPDDRAMMATMLAFLTCDAEVPPALLKRALAAATRDTFNAITVDGECSTNDTVFAMASGASGVKIDEALYPAFEEGLRAVAKELAIGIVRGGEGATKLVTVRVKGAREWAHAERAARTIANSLLVKTAIHGGDPNWGRLVAAAGRSGVPFELSRAGVRVGGIVLFEHGQPHDANADKAAAHCPGPMSTSKSIWVPAARAGCGLDLRSERRVRQNQRRLPDLKCPHVRTKDFVSVLDFEPQELEACLNSRPASNATADGQGRRRRTPRRIPRGPAVREAVAANDLHFELPSASSAAM